MGLFAKKEYLEVVLPFLCDRNSADAEACIISIEAYGRILNDYRYCYASFEVCSNDYDELSELLMATDNKLVKVIATVKSGIVKGFKIDLDDLAERYHDKRFGKLALLGWGLNEKSFIELTH